MSAPESATDQPGHEETLDAIRQAWAKHSNLRLVQLIDYALEATGRGASFYADNRTLVAALDKARLRSKLP